MDKMELYVGNISFECNEDDIRQIFGEFDLYNVNMKINDKKAFCFVTLSKENAKKALREMDGILFKGRRLIIKSVKALRNRSKSLSRSNAKPDHSIIRKLNRSFENDQVQNPLSVDLSTRKVVFNLSEDIFKNMPQLVDIPEDYLRCNSCVNCLKRIRMPKMNNIEEESQNNGRLMPKSDTSPISSSLEPLCKIVVCGYPWDSTEEELMNHFKSFYPCEIKMNGTSDLTYTYLFLPNRKLAEQAATSLNGTKFKGAKIKVTYVPV